MSHACGGAERGANPTPSAANAQSGNFSISETKITRAISLAPSITELVFAAGAGDKLVGVTTYCDYPEAARKIQKVGDTQSPNIEAIIALKPQVVFVSTASQLEAFLGVWSSSK